MNRWVLASSNSGKLKEFQHALAPVLNARGITLVNQSDLGINGAEEPFHTFEENALAKARHASLASGLPALADDSGLCVDVLLGAPGVRSARYFSDAQACAAAEDLSDLRAIEALQLSIDESNLRWLLRETLNALGLHQAPIPARPIASAQFHAAIAFVRSADDAAPIIVTGIWPGQLYSAPVGDHGFGYDPIFFDPNIGLTAAQMTIDQKRAVSHRGRALDALLARLCA
ncbi:MAG: non-canonical purine NTP pyrophosphatase [Burkholderiaceae bacterium]|nr:non-canonical purine NTP pyrophosphatase [Burkholderiaceae bacterium]